MTHDPELHKRLLRIMTANTFAERYGFTQEDGWILLDMHLNVALKTANEMLRRATRAEDKAASLEEKTDIEQAALWSILATTQHVSVVSKLPLTENDIETFRQCMTVTEKSLGLSSPEQDSIPSLLREAVDPLSSYLGFPTDTLVVALQAPWLESPHRLDALIDSINSRYKALDTRNFSWSAPCHERRVLLEGLGKLALVATTLHDSGSPEVREQRREQYLRDLERDVPFLVSQLREVRSRTPPAQPTSAAEVPAPRVDKFSWGEGSHTSYLKKTA